MAFLRLFLLAEAEGNARPVMVVWVYAAAALLVAHGDGFFDMCRPAGGYIGYTYVHLPNGSRGIPLPSTEVASDAILAARMAFSSLIMRS